MNVLLCLSHSIEEHDQLLLMHELGHSVASIGGYIDPAHPHDPKRPALPQVPMVPEVKAAVDAIGSDDNLGAAQTWLPDAVLDWADVIVYHHMLGRLYGQWPRIEAWRTAKPGRRVIWRTVGQSVEANEADARLFRDRGLEIVRYSPKERAIPGYAGEDALIRFWKDPAEWDGWTGEDRVVLNITQDLFGRDPWCNPRFYLAATEGLPRRVIGPESERAPFGLGTLPLPEMQDHLRRARAYLYTGTQPASYTLGLIEAMMTGVPVVSIGPAWMGIFPYGRDLFEGHELAVLAAHTPEAANAILAKLLDDDDFALEMSRRTRERAIEVFGKATVAAAWRDYLPLGAAVAA